MSRRDAPTILKDLQHRLAEAWSVDNYLDLLIEGLATELEADRGCLMLERGREFHYPRGVKFNYSRQIVDSVLDEGQAMLCIDAANLSSEPSMSVKANQIRSVLCVPVGKIRNEESLIYLDSSKLRGAFHEPDILLLQELVRVMAPQLDSL